MKKSEKSELQQTVEDFLIGEIGQYFESMGAKVLMGRVWGLLITRTGPVSLKQMSETLKVSKSALGFSLNILVQLGAIKKVYIPEHPRESNYILEADSIAMVIDPGIQKMGILLTKFDKAITLLKNLPTEEKNDSEFLIMTKRIALMRDSMDVVLTEYLKFGEIVKLKVNELEKKYFGGK